MFEFLINIWYLWVLVIIVVLYKIFRPSIKGWFGEKTVALYLKALPKDEYNIVNDVILPSDNGTTQIDHVVISLYGIFVIETKNYVGWIYGDEKSDQWIQNIYGKKNSFMNPIHQNFGHVKAIEKRLIQYSNLPIVPIVAFSAKCDLKVKTLSNVVYFHRICAVIRSYNSKVLSSSDVLAIVNLLYDENIHSAKVKKEHVETINNMKSEIECATVGGKCPKCSGTLIERCGKYGAFIGCSNYPKCRFSKQA